MFPANFSRIAVAVAVLGIAGALPLKSQTSAANRADAKQVIVASLHPTLAWQRTSPPRGQMEGPVLYQLLFSASGTPGALARFDTNPRHLTDSLIRDNGSLVTIGGMSVDSTGFITFVGSQTFPASTLLGVVPIANGGTGITTAPAAGQFLRGTGAGAWGIGSIQGSDLPSLSGAYVDLTTAQTVGGSKTFSNTITGNGNLALPNTASGGTAGVVTLGGTAFLHNFGALNAFNTFVGASAGNMSPNLTGTDNTGVGGFALFSNTTGFANSAFGQSALASNTTGVVNTAFGASALASNTTGSSNAAFGRDALSVNTTGNSNSAFGGNALFANTIGTSNAAFGGNALQSNTTGGSNAAFGGNALSGNTTGGSNSAFGASAFASLTSGDSNVAIGQGAGASLTTGSHNIYIGSFGMSSESNTIRIGSLGLQTAAFIAGNVTLPGTLTMGGQVTFAGGQTFPGTGSVTSVGTSTGLTGGPITTIGTLAIDTSVVPELGASNIFIGNNTFNNPVSANITGNAATANNALALGGQPSSAFAPASGSANYVAKAGDTMTGTLNLPANGLVAGTNQLVLSSGRVGIGIATPTAILHVVGGAPSSGIGDDIILKSGDAFTAGVPSPNGGNITLVSGHGAGQSGAGGNFSFTAGNGSTNGLPGGPGGGFNWTAGTGGGVSGFGGTGGPGGGFSWVAGNGGTTTGLGGAGGGFSWTSGSSGGPSGGNAAGNFVWTVGNGNPAGSFQFLNGNLGIGTSSPAQKLDVSGNINASGSVTATSFSGNLSCTGCVTNADLAAGSVNAGNIVSGQVVKSLNGLFDNVTLAAGTNIALGTSGQTVTITDISPAAWTLGGNIGTGCSTTPCADFLGSTDNDPIEFRVNNQRAYRIEPATDSNSLLFAPNVIGGFAGNAVTGGVGGATIAGGGESGQVNSVSGNDGTIGGGRSNTASGFVSTVSGGSNNNATGSGAWVGGTNNAASGNSTFVAGNGNSATGPGSAVPGGESNHATAADATVGGGIANTAGGSWSTVPGGLSNTADGFSSFAAGAETNDGGFNGVFVWGDNTTQANGTFTKITATAANQFLARASGGVTFYSNSALTAGVTLSAGGGSWSSVSDRNVKANFAAVDGKDILARVIAMPVTSWNYKAQAASIRHIGPMAQDFFAAFNVGEDDKHITTIDEGGVALAAIQGLNQKLEEEGRQKDEEIRILREQLSLQAQQLRAIREDIGLLRTAQDSHLLANK